jgi:hypothetical protein
MNPRCDVKNKKDYGILFICGSVESDFCWNTAEAIVTLETMNQSLKF